jgi:threonine aldolase
MPTDLRSDTVTRPTAAMRRAMADAEVGDDVLDGDPTVARLQDLVAGMLGKERALFFPSGTMANQSALWLLAVRGTEILLDAESHIVHYEVAGAAGLCGAQLRPVHAGGPGVMDAESLRAAIRSPSKHVPRASLVCVENTHNGAGGVVSSAAALAAVRRVAEEHRLPVHMDGARLWNAAAELRCDVADLAAHADTVMVSFSKGLGAPVGAALAGPRALMDEAWSVRKRFGGGMRQSGILAAGAIHGIQHNMDRLTDDHANARLFAERVEGAGGARVVAPQSNIVMVDLPAGIPASEIAAALSPEGVLITVWSPSRLRAVFHLDVSVQDATAAALTLARTLEQAASRAPSAPVQR